MDKERLLKLADILESGEPYGDMVGFRMSAWGEPQDSGQDCGTVGCIAGWAYSVFGDGTPITRTPISKLRRCAREYLGLSHHQARELFVPIPRTMIIATREQAAAVLRLVADGIPPESAWETVMERDND